MKIEPFLRIFDDLADSPERIPALRKVILSFLLNSAVGSPDALSCAEVIREAHEERRHDKKFSNKDGSSVLPAVTDEELPPGLSNIPASLFERLGNIASIEKGLSQIQRTKPGRYPLVVTAEARNSSDLYYFEGPATIIPMVSSTGHGDASLKRLHYQEGRYAVGNILAVVKPICPDLIRARFIYEYLSAFKDELLVSRMVGTANVSLTVNKLKEVPVPMLSGPVFNHIDELMALCDRLEKQQQERDTRHAALARASLARFADAPTPANLNHLFHPSYDISPTDLRKTILSLAVQGKLVSQESNDEPASVLLSRILANNPRLCDSFKEPAAQMEADEAFTDIPDSWVTVALGRLMKVTSSKRIFESEYSENGVPFFRSKEIGDLSRGEDIKTTLYISAERYLELKEHADFPQSGDLLLTSVGTIGNTWIVDEREFYFKDGNITQIIQTYGVDMRFVQLYISSPLFTDAVEKIVAGTAYSALTIVKIKGMILPLPPLAEQRRIVAKVDQLMALVDQLETQLSDSRATAINLMEAVVAELTVQE
jgi:type I restriction enzyme S subunit